MLKHLLEYDFKSKFKVLIIFYALATFFALLTRIFFSFENSLVLYIIAQVCSGVTISIVFNILINNIMRMWARFRTNFYGDESYLTHTLPVSKTTHYLSKFICAAVSFLVSFAFIGVALFVAYYSEENIQIIKSLILPLAQTYDSSIGGLIIVLLLILYLEFFNILQCGFTGIILGHRMQSGKVGFSVLYGFIVYSASQTAVLVAMFIVALFNNDAMNLFVTNEMVDIGILKFFIIFAIIIYTLISVVLCFINIKLFKKGVNVD